MLKRSDPRVTLDKNGVGTEHTGGCHHNLDESVSEARVSRGIDAAQDAIVALGFGEQDFY